jgi:anaerobic selenocysteine-containing dehydrogenase
MQTERPSVCPLDCPDTCSLLVTVEDDKVVRVRGSDANPFTKSAICNKVARGYPEFVHGENRLTVPLRRTGAKGEGRFEEISWTQALDTIHDRFTAVIGTHGPQAIAPFNYAGPHGAIADHAMSARFFNKLGATQLNRGALCGGVKHEAYTSVFGGLPGTAPEHAEDAKLIVVWSNNVTVSNLHLTSIIERARKKGATLVVVDPKRIKIAERADLFLPLEPGTDTILAWAITAELERTGDLDNAFVDRWVLGFDEYMTKARRISISDAAAICKLPEDDIRRFSDFFRTYAPAAISIGNGLERNRNGGAGIRALLALAALAGTFGVRGGGVIAKAGNAFPRTPARLQRPDFAPKNVRTLNIIDMASHILDDTLDPPIKSVFIFNHNPVTVHPDQNRMIKALSRKDLFTVGCDVVMTDSMLFADIVLPASSHFEYDDIYAAYGQHYLQRAAPVIPRVGGSLPNTEIFRRLAARFGFNDPAFAATDAQLMDDAFDLNDPRLAGTRPSELPTGTAHRMLANDAEFIPFVNAFPTTPSGKVELHSADLDARYGEGLPSYRALESDYPLFLISPSSDKRINATFGGLKASDAMPVLEMHPEDAAMRKLQDGAIVTVWNDLGDVPLRLRITDAVRPGIVYSPKGAWFRTSETGQTVSALVPSTKADICGGACYNDCRVEVAAREAA